MPGIGAGVDTIDPATKVLYTPPPIPNAGAGSATGSQGMDVRSVTIGIMQELRPEDIYLWGGLRLVLTGFANTHLSALDRDFLFPCGGPRASET